MSLYYTIVNDHFPPGENNTVFSKMLPLSYIIAAAVVAIVVLTAVITVVSVCCLSRKKRQGNKWGIVMSVVLMRVFTLLSETSTLFSELLLYIVYLSLWST